MSRKALARGEQVVGQSATVHIVKARAHLEIEEESEVFVLDKVVEDGIWNADAGTGRDCDAVAV